MDRSALLAEIDAFRDRVKISETAVGLGAVNDGKFVSELRAGRRCWPDTAHKVLAFINGYERGARAA